MASSRHLVLFGGALDTGNLGVAALGTSLIEGVARASADVDITVFDNGWGLRYGSVSAGHQELRYQARGARLSRRYYRSESLQVMYLLAQLGGLGNPGVRTVAKAMSVLDVSGGDSFTDMYGPKRFRTVVMPKRLALRLRRSLILLPQTYGPFYDDKHRSLAAQVVKGASDAWARDDRSFEVLAELLGDDLDERRHRVGVDMAFGLTPTEPVGPRADELRQWLDEPGPVVGINISGLLFATLPR